MNDEMKLRLRLFRRNNGIYFCEDRETRTQHSLQTKDKTEAMRLLNAKNEALGDPSLALQIAKAYLAAADPLIPKRTWRFVAEELVKTKHGENARRWQNALKDQQIVKILPLTLIQTRAENFLAALHAGTVSTNAYLRRLHNFALGIGWLLCPVLPPKQWPKVHYKAKRAITREEHERIVAREGNAERRAFYELLWELGGSQGDVAKLRADDIDWRTKTLSYFRAKTGQPAQICFDEEVAQILRRLPAKGPLFP
jgi:integrase